MDRSNDSSGSSSSSSRRWTCEACGCNTNTESDRNCTICGTSQGSSLSRRVGYAARSGLFARSVAARRSFMQEELGMDGYELWERVDDDADMQGEEEEHAIAALAMEVAGVSGRDPNRHRSVIEAARSFAASRETATRPDATELLRVAYENASLYQPTWMNPLQIGGRMRTGNGIELGEGDCRNVAHLPLGAGEGRALRALEAFPRSAPFASVNLVSHNNPSQDRRPRRSFGFRVAFEHPTKEAGKNMGGYYLVGVTTTSFAAFSERNALQQSPFFWGIEDCGNKYEGTRNPPSRDHRRGQPSHAIELSPSEAKRNEDNVLFGSREVVTCVVDLESRSLTFWRDEELLGTLITNLPRGGSLYPVAVPYNAGSTVAITGMGGDPLPLLRSFATDWKQALKDKNDQRRKKLQAERAVLIKDRELTPKLIRTLKIIFSWYAEDQQQALQSDNPQLNLVAASRLWYRCGMKLSLLDTLLEEEKDSEDNYIEFKDFINTLERVVLDEDKEGESEEHNPTGSPSFEVGDKVELVEGYERFGDAANGPLHPGERGVVIDLQEGPNGERHSVRVMHNTRRWWYQPPALVREKSGLTESPLVWFLRSILRAHGICHTSLEPFIGTEVTATSWRVGDAVVPKKTAVRSQPGYAVPDDCEMEETGRVVTESSNSASSLTARGRDSGSVLVEYIGRSFARACGAQSGGSPFAGSAHETRRVPANKLLHTTSQHGVSVSKNDPPAEESKVLATADHMEISECPGGTSDQVLDNLKKMRDLDPSAIESIRKECENNATALATAFEGGLPKSLLGAIDAIGERISGTDERDNLTQVLSAVGKLSLLIAKTTFPDANPIQERERDARTVASPEQGSSSDNEEESAAAERQGAQRNETGSSERLEQVQESAFFQDLGAQGSRLSSVQQRRNILLALMSRARRVNPSGDVLNRELRGAGGGGPSIGHPLPPLDQFRNDAAALLFGVRGDLDDSTGDADEDIPSNDNAASSTTASSRNVHPNPRSRGGARPESSVLDSILRGRSQKGRASSSSKTSVPSTLLRSAIVNGLLGNSLQWLKAVSQSQSKKPSKQSSKSGAWLKSAADEDGTPLLQLAISLGCSIGIIRFLVRLGAPVTETEIKLAAKYELPDTLSVLLQSSVYHEGMIDLENCSPGVANVINDVVKRQKRQQLSMRKESTSLLAAIVQKLISLCLQMRHHHEGTETCSRSIADALVGNVMLNALQQQQQKDNSSTSDSGRRSGGLQSGCERSSSSSKSQGILSNIPAEIFAESLVNQPNHLSAFLLLVEDYLCSKDINDSAIGLSLLSFLLKRFSSFGRSAEVERFGFVELLSSHDAFASNRLAEIASNVGMRDPGLAANECSEAETLAQNGVVLCPKKHTAHLHVTLHSSFRCDLCGKGVERGRVMHGCRECDWDACERCTDEAEGGIVKWNHIRELAAECQRLLSQVGQKSDKSSRSSDQKMVKLLTEMDNSSEINNLSIRLLQRDPSSIKALETVLNTSGELTVHQFISVILPALHASLLGKPSDNAESNLESILYHRNKKPRVVGATLGEAMGPSSSSGEDMMEFARLLFFRHCLRKDGSNQEDNEDGKTGTDGEKGRRSSFKSELLRRLHQVLSLYENVPALPNVHSRVGRGTLKLGELQSLTKPLQLCLTPVARQKGAQATGKEHATLNLHMEPLTSVDDLSNHLLRTCKVSLPLYNTFCRRLAAESAILLERPSSCLGSNVRKWRVCKVVSYNEDLGSHGVRYAVNFHGSNDRRLEISNSNQQNLQALQFDEMEESNLILAVREFYIISRDRQKTENRSAFDMDELLTDEIVPKATEEGLPSLRAATRGSRVESNLGRLEWKPCTILLVQVDETNEKRYTVVMDDGEVFGDIPEKSVRGLPADENDSEDESATSRVDSRRGGRDSRGQISRSFPFMSARRDAAEGNRSQPVGAAGVMKRTWSALSLTEAMRPVELAVPDSSGASKPSDSVGFPVVRTVCCTIDDREIDVSIDRAVLELPPIVRVRYSIGTTPIPAGSHTQSDVTLISLLSHLYQNDGKKLFSDQVHQISYSMSCERYHERMIPVQSTMKVDDNTSTKAAKALACRSPSPEPHNAEMVLAEEMEPRHDWEQVSRSRKFNHLTTYSPGGDDVCSREICQGLDEICIQCMEIIGLLAVLADKATDASEKKNDEASIFANKALSKKLTEQLDDPLHVAGGLLPNWCFKAPCFSPRTFSYRSRKLLLERAAFGVSRSTLRQQESKVKDVGRFRQRMASLRARAVELVGEAFSGGAEDPTALQLQADELYGMEEALAAKVKANFRAAKWEEHALQVAKAAVNRDLLIADAVSIMDQYANDGSLSRRRLEVRFNGESGFDAAAGDEAGVTRGFYADVAEALLSCEIVSGVGVASFCDDGPSATVTSLLASNSKGLPCKLPLWIPDVDASNHVIIPTPRADPSSGIGVYPRPLSSLHPQMPIVMKQFRFMGRLFASAMRDGFMLPLPLSTSFLKLVLNCHYNTNVRSGESGMLDEEIAAISSRPVATSLALTSNELPRPGFLGGEVYAAEMHICRALDRLDQIDPPLSRDELENKYREIATDKSFARSAMGKTFDCSFEDYFQDRTFVDPLDPEQGVGAFPLCANGHARNVTIHNIREWIALAKEFILNDGVMAQAMAFRRGVEDFFSADFLRLFTPEELQSDVCGVGDNVDSWTEADVRKLFKLDGGKGAAEALVAVAAIGGEGGAALSRRFGPSSPTIGFVVKALLEATPKMRRQFLSFVTSVPIVTPGQIEVVPVVSPSGEFMPMRDPTCLPRANTCARRLYLPKFETFDSFKQVLWAVVSEESKFKGFYEWRG